VYGSHSIHTELADDHYIRIDRKRVARLMRAGGLERCERFGKTRYQLAEIQVEFADDRNWPIETVGLSAVISNRLM
jgi:hypothetical protein